MPYTVKKRGNQYCVFKKNADDSLGEQVKCHPTKQKAIDHLGALASNVKEMASELEKVMLEDGGPVLQGIAVTNRPGIPLPEMSIVEKDGKKYIRTPFLSAGIYQDPRYGKLIFSSDVFDQMLKNHKNKRNHFGISLDLRHMPEKGALAWYSEKKGGFIQQEEDPEYGKLLVGYGVPTGQDAIDLIENGKYIYASVDYSPNYKSPLVQRLSTDDLVTVENEDLVILEDNVSDEVTIAQTEYDELKAKVTDLEALKAELAEIKSKLTTAAEAKQEAEEKNEELEEKVTKLEADLQNVRVETDPEIPDNIRVQLEQQNDEIARLKREALVSRVNAIIERAKAYRDKDGRGHAPVLLEVARAAMLGETIEVEGADSIKLEAADVVSVAGYARKAWEHLLAVLPGQVQMESRTSEDTNLDNPLGDGNKYSKEDFASLWSQSI